MVYTELKKEFVIQTLGNGTEVIAVDFRAMKMQSCLDMTIKTINKYIANNETKFYKVEINE